MFLNSFNIIMHEVIKNRKNLNKNLESGNFELFVIFGVDLRFFPKKLHSSLQKNLLDNKVHPC